MDLITELKSLGFTSIKYQDPGSIQICANHLLGNGIWFYSKHNVALISVFKYPFTWTENQQISIRDIWEYTAGEEIDYVSRNLQDDNGGLLEDTEVLRLFKEMWNEHLSKNK